MLKWLYGEMLQRESGSLSKLGEEVKDKTVVLSLSKTYLHQEQHLYHTEVPTSDQSPLLK